MVAISVRQLVDSVCERFGIHPDGAPFYTLGELLDRAGDDGQADDADAQRWADDGGRID